MRRLDFLLHARRLTELDLVELTQGANPAPRHIAREMRFRDSVTQERMAACVREYLGITVDMQSAWRDDDSALKAWRSALQPSDIYPILERLRRR